MTTEEKIIKDKLGLIMACPPFHDIILGIVPGGQASSTYFILTKLNNAYIGAYM